MDSSSLAPARAGRGARNVLFWCVVGFLAANAIILLCVFWPVEPVYQGRPISRWIEASHPTLQHPAVNFFGTNAVPFLLQALEGHRSMFNQLAWRFWPHLPRIAQSKLRWLKPVDVAGTRSGAVNWFLELGPDARAALPRLLELARNQKDANIRYAAVSLIGVVGGGARATVPALAELLKDPNPAIEDAAMLALARAGPAAAPAVPELVRLLEKRRRPKAFYAAPALGAIGPAANQPRGRPNSPHGQAVGALLKALDDPDLEDDALAALLALGPAAAPALPRLLDYLKADPPAAPVRVLEIIGQIGPKSKNALPEVQRIEKTSRGVPRILAAVACWRIEGQIGPAAAVVAEELRRALPKKQGEIRTEPEIFWTIHLPNPTSPMPAAFGLGARETAAWFLGEIGPPAAGSLPELQSELVHGTHWGRVIAARSIFRITRQGEAVLPILRQSLFSGDDYEFSMALRVLREMGPSAERAAPWLTPFLDDPTRPWSQRRQVRQLLGRVSSAGGPN